MPDDNTPYITISDLSLEMRCGIFTNAAGVITIVHDQEIKEPIEWLQYDKESGAIYIVFQSGRSQILGIKMNKKAHDNLLQATEVEFILIQNEKIINQKKLPLTIQEY